ncbi:MAG: pyridoxamine 5'-phosphate oxidase family protein, partial [Muribaculaceae bacterium]|nr:pyridoxamine 5'-phosphate oxidase family protein [Muribaculaceae bacterium]
VTDGLITSEQLLDAFVGSANAASHPSAEAWAAQWHVMLDTMGQMGRKLPHMERDLQLIDSVLALGHYAISHSPDYRKAYHPHYRIVERTIFERELKPSLETPHRLLTQQHQQAMLQNINEVQEYLKACGVFYIATVDGDQPRVRPFGVSEIINGRLYIMTGKVKDVFKQMDANGKFEICALKPSGTEWMRLSGILVNDDDLAVKQEFLERNPSLKTMYSPDDGNMAVLYITAATARFCSFSAPERSVTF